MLKTVVDITKTFRKGIRVVLKGRVTARALVLAQAQGSRRLRAYQVTAHRSAATAQGGITFQTFCSERMVSANSMEGKKQEGTFWDDRWVNNDTPWDMGTPTPALISQLEKVPKGTALVPGCGAAYDLNTLAKHCTRVVGLDISPTALEKARSICKGHSNVDIVQGDAFEIDLGTEFDFIFDYTFFCALPPARRDEWGSAIAKFLKPGGKLLTLVFPIDEASAFDPDAEGPPFPVSVAAYERVLLPRGFSKVSEARSEASISPRRDREKVVWWVKDL